MHESSCINNKATVESDVINDPNILKYNFESVLIKKFIYRYF